MEASTGVRQIGFLVPPSIWTGRKINSYLIIGLNAFITIYNTSLLIYITVLCAIAGIGSHLSWSATGIAYFTKIGVIVNKTQISLVASLLPLGATLGTLPVGILADKYGRKIVSLFSILLTLISWFIISSVQTKAGLYGGRFLGGLGCGATSVVIPMYFSEICFKETHQRIVNKIQVSLNFGIFWSYFVCFGIYKNRQPSLKYFQGTKLLFTGFASLIALFILILPESPMWLQNHGRNEEAEVALRKIGTHYPVVGRPDPVKVIGNSGLRSSVLKTIKNRKDMILIMCLLALQIISGIGALTFFLTDYFYLIINHNSLTYIYCILLIVPILTTFLNVQLQQCIEEKYRLILSTCLMAISAFSLAGFSYAVQPWDTNKEDSLYVILTILMAAYLSAFQIGLGPVPWIMIGKMFPSNNRKMVYNLAATYSWTLLFTSTLGCVDLLKSVDIHFVFLIYALVNIVATCVTIFGVPKKIEEARENDVAL